MTSTTRTKRHGLTLPELIIGTAMLGIIGSALVSFTLAVSAGWTNSDRQFKVENAGKVSSGVLEATLSGMLYVAQSKTSTPASPGSYVFYWNKDGGLLEPDKLAQVGEMALVEFDPVSGTIYRYQPRESGLTPEQKALHSTLAWSDPTSPDIIPYFKSLDSVERKPLIGGASSGIEVSDANFRYFTPTGSKSMTSYSLTLSNGATQDTSSGTIPMRTGRKPANFN